MRELLKLTRSTLASGTRILLVFALFMCSCDSKASNGTSPNRLAIAPLPEHETLRDLTAMSRETRLRKLAADAASRYEGFLDHGGMRGDPPPLAVDFASCQLWLAQSVLRDYENPSSYPPIVVYGYWWRRNDGRTFFGAEGVDGNREPKRFILRVFSPNNKVYSFAYLNSGSTKEMEFNLIEFGGFEIEVMEFQRFADVLKQQSVEDAMPVFTEEPVPFPVGESVRVFVALESRNGLVSSFAPVYEFNRPSQ